MNWGDIGHWARRRVRTLGFILIRFRSRIPLKDRNEGCALLDRLSGRDQAFDLGGLLVNNLDEFLGSQGFLSLARAAITIAGKPAVALAALFAVLVLLVFTADGAANRVAELGMLVADTSALPHVVKPVFWVVLLDRVLARLACGNTSFFDAVRVAEDAVGQSIGLFPIAPRLAGAALAVGGLAAVGAQGPEARTILLLKGGLVAAGGDADVVVTTELVTEVAHQIAFSLLAIETDEVATASTLLINHDALLGLDVERAVLDGAPLLAVVKLVVSTGALLRRSHCVRLCSLAFICEFQQFIAFRISIFI